MGNISRFLQLEPRFAGEAAVEIVGILEETRQRREERKRYEPSFAVFKYCSMKPFLLTYIVCSSHHLSLLRLVREQKNRVGKV